MKPTYDSITDYFYCKAWIWFRFSFWGFSVFYFTNYESLLWTLLFLNKKYLKLTDNSAISFDRFFLLFWL